MTRPTSIESAAPRGADPSPKGKLYSLQALRAAAAILVILDHSILESRPDQQASTALAYALGTFGVDLFFVISGFIMVYIGWDEIGRVGAASRFLVRRILRIAPVYWIATIVAFAYHRFSNTHGADDGLSELIRSLLFIPYRDDMGGWTPVLPQGWTLSYEMMFYVIFAIALLLHRTVALPTVVACLTVLSMVGFILPPGALAHLASPILLWFVVGIMLGWAWRAWRLAEPSWLATRLRFAVPVGDASYSTYLVHGAVITLVARGWMMAVGEHSLLQVPLGLVLALICGHVVHRLLEKPVWRVAIRSQRIIGAGMRSSPRLRTP